MHVMTTSRKDWPWILCGLVFCAFLVAFYLPLPSKGINNLFYVGVALPAFVWWLWRPAAIPVMAKGFAWMLALLGLLSVLDAGDAADMKKGLYLLLLFLACLLIEQSRYGMKGVLLLFTVVSVLVLLYSAGLWGWACLRAGKWYRLGRVWGEVINPVHFALMINTALVFLWLFFIEQRLISRSKSALVFALAGLCLLVLFCSTVFQARSALLGFALFLGAYILWYRRMFIIGAVLLAGLLALLFWSGASELLIRRGFSYRPEIWQDAWLRVWNHCGIWLGCGSDNYLFLGRFYHPHSGYMSIFYRSGLPGIALLAAFAVILFWRAAKVRSPWGLLAVMGWGGLLTSSNGMFTSPQPLWVYFWVPTFMAVIDSQRDVVNAYFAARRSAPAAVASS